MEQGSAKQLRSLPCIIGGHTTRARIPCPVPPGSSAHPSRADPASTVPMGILPLGTRGYICALLRTREVRGSLIAAAAAGGNYGHRCTPISLPAGLVGAGSPRTAGADLRHLH